MPWNRIKRIHYSPGSKQEIVCGVSRNRDRRVRYTRHRKDITCDRCTHCLEAKENDMGDHADDAIENAMMESMDGPAPAEKSYRAPTLFMRLIDTGIMDHEIVNASKNVAECLEEYDPGLIQEIEDAANLNSGFDSPPMHEAKKLAANFYRRRFEELFRNLGIDKAKCRGCGRVIFWVTHANGKRAPYTVDGRSHFIDCPAADMFRGKN